MYRGSRLAASFLLVLTGLTATAVALLVLPPVVGATGSRWLTPIVLAFAILHFAARSPADHRRTPTAELDG